MGRPEAESNPCYLSSHFAASLAKRSAFNRSEGFLLRIPLLPSVYRRHQTNEFDPDRRMIAYARFPIRTTFPSLRGTRDTTAALARSSKAVAMYFA